jgi:hypothetical protein
MISDQQFQNLFKLIEKKELQNFFTSEKTSEAMKKDIKSLIEDQLK